MKKIFIIFILLFISLSTSCSQQQDSYLSKTINDQEVKHVDIVSTPTEISVTPTPIPETYLSKDKKYLEYLKINYNKTVETTIINEIQRLEFESKNLISKGKKLKSGAILYDEATSLNISERQNAIYQRHKFLQEKISFTYNENQFVDIFHNALFSINGNVTFYDDFYKDVVKILESDLLPKGLVSNIKFFILPYDLNDGEGGVGGYVNTNYFAGKDEIICITNNISILFHELGHLYANKVIGKNNATITSLVSNKYFWQMYTDFYPDFKFGDTWETSIYESFAEDFKIYFCRKFIEAEVDLSSLSKDSLKETKKLTDNHYNTNFKDVLTMLDLFTIPNIKSFPDVFINNNPIHLVFSGYDIVTTNEKLDIKLTSEETVFRISDIIIQFDDQEQAYNGEFYFPKNGKYKILFLIEDVDEKVIINEQTIVKI